MYKLMKNYKLNTHKPPDQERNHSQQPQIQAVRSGKPQCCLKDANQACNPVLRKTDADHETSLCIIYILLNSIILVFLFFLMFSTLIYASLNRIPKYIPCCLNKICS